MDFTNSQCQKHEFSRIVQPIRNKPCLYFDFHYGNSDSDFQKPFKLGIHELEGKNGWGHSKIVKIRWTSFMNDP
jgi:hypothetical protein